MSDVNVTGSALVLGGGGVAGIAWTTGLLAGLGEAGFDVTGADVLIGTSAGATVTAQVGSGLSLDELYERQVDPALQSEEILVELDMESFGAGFASVLGGSPTEEEVRRRVGQFALDTETVPEARRREVVAARLPSVEWPRRELVLVAVDAATGEPVRFTRESGVELIDAVAASCAVPGVWPPVTIGDRRFVDGGVRSMDNLDYAAGAERITVIAPLLHAPAVFPGRLTTEIADDLRAGGASVVLIGPDESSVEAIGTNPLDPATRGPAAAAGREQGRKLGAELASR